MEFKDWYSLDESAELIAQSRFPESQEEDLKNAFERVVARSEHKKTLIKKAQAGELSLHTSYLVQIPANEILFHLKNNAGLLNKNLEKYADDIGIKLFADIEVTKYTKPKLSWNLKPLSEIQRMNGYRTTIQKMYNEGKSAPPLPQEVLASWRIEFKDQPKDVKIYVLSKSFEYLNDMGVMKTVDTKSLNGAIKRLITTD
jgi:hypothetical protein